MKNRLGMLLGIGLAAAATAQEIGYVETFSLAADREAALKELVPGTDDYFYYHALHAQNLDQRERFQKVIDDWIRERKGVTPGTARELLNRQALLDYEKDPKKSLDYIRDQLKLTFPHARKTGERRSDAPTAFDNARISTDTLMKRALAADPGGLEKIEDAGLELAAGQPINDEQRRNLLSRLQRPDLPGLVDRIVADLAFRDSRGFGSMEIHRRLTLAQMDELLQKKPDLRNQSNFVTSYLLRLAPVDEADLETEPAVREAYYDRAWAFVKTLDPVHNSLKACILYNRLLHDRKMGVLDRARFLDYIKLPRNVWYLRDEIRQGLPRGDHLARLDRDFQIAALPPIANEEPLVRAILLDLFRDAPNADEFKPWLRDDFLKRTFAESKIVHGVGDPQQWAALLSPEEFRRLKERVDIDFAPDNPDTIAPDAPVKLTAHVKNVQDLIVKVYEINTLNYYRETGSPLNLAINLDGLVASSEKRVEYKETAERRIARTFEFPELNRRGAWVVELIGKGKSSRALVQKGRLGVLQEVTASGHAFTVLDEASRRVPDARAWLAGREFVPGKDGRILVPFSTAPKTETLVVQQGGFASPVRFEHLAEAYSLHAGLYVDREALLRREKAVALLRPVLSVNGQPVSLKLLEEVRLTISATDLQGISTEKEIPDIALREDAETTVEFLVPEQTVSLALTLKAKIRNVSLNKREDLAGTASFDLNGIDRTESVQDLHVTRTAAGYAVDLRGKNGEPRAGEPLFCTFKHRLFRDEVTAELKTDAQGRALLGALDGLEWFRVREPAGLERTWPVARGACARPPALHGRAGDVIRVPLAEAGGADAASEASLLEVRNGAFVKDWREALAVADGFLELRALPAGDYSLYLKPEAREIEVRVTDGEARDGFAFSPRRALELPRLAPLQIAAVEPGADAIAVRLANASPFTRVHVLGTRYLPAYDVFGSLGFSGTPGLRAQPWTPSRTFYESGRDIGDEYRYILDRQSARKFPGTMLDRPGLLLNPWELRDTQTEAEALRGGGTYAGRTGGMGGAAAAGAPVSSMRLMRGEQAQSSSLDFLKSPATVLANLRPDANGVVSIPRAALAGRPFVRIVAVDPTATVLRHVAIEDSPVETRELRLVTPLDPARTYAEQRIVTPVQAKAKLAIADATTARFETIDTVAKAFRLLSTLAGNATLEEFAFIAGWPDLPAAEKRTLYSKHACHELNFFLSRKDPEFFKAVVAPYLKNKKDKTFLDLWLLDGDLKPFVDPWRFARLNAVEQILLGKRIAVQEASVARDIRERADLIPPDVEDFSRRFDTAVQAGALEDQGGVREEIALESRKQIERGVVALKELAVAPSAPPAAMRAMPASAAPAAAFGAVMPAEADGLAMNATADKPMDARRRSFNRMDADGAAPGGEVAKKALAKGQELAFFAEEKLERQAARRFFQKLDQTKEWAENNYYKLPVEKQLADLVAVNAFWADYAAHDGKSPFLSKSFVLATRNFTELMFALSVLDLPFKAGAHAEKLDGLAYVLDAATPLVVFHREIREAARSDEPAGVLVAQNFFRADDRYRHEGNEQFDKFVTEEFLPGTVYGAQVVLTNPTGNRQKLQVLLQIPAGAIAVAGGLPTRGVYVDLEPHGTETVEYFFYFPTVGSFAHYPVTLARNDKVVAGAAPFAFNVVAQLTKIDKTSWAWLSQNGSPEEVLAFLRDANLHRLNLVEMAWRMKDAAFFRPAVDLLAVRHKYDHVLWSYAFLHNDATALRAYLAHSPFADRCGLHLVSPLLVLDPVERLDHQHLEYSPLVNPRTHAVGEKRKILNNRFREQYQRLMKVLSYKPSLTDVDELAVAYYMTLQDRVAEALDWFAKVDRKAVPEQIQCDYLAAYLAFYRGDLDGARAIAKARAEESVDRWRVRFAQVLAQLDEAAGAAAAAADAENRDQAQGALAATEPALELQVEAGRIRIDHRNLKSVTLNFYPMDIELLFSRSPFLQEGSAQFSYIRPVLAQAVEPAAGRDSTTVDLPAQFKARNVMVEALGGGVRKTQAYYANTLKVQMVETYGQVVVTHADTLKPVPGAYVKVYLRTKGGEVKFFKDGYTDLRGRFDYASVNTNELDDAARMAVLVLDENLGAVVREAAPPKK
jgi:hypothetical protein